MQILTSFLITLSCRQFIPRQFESRTDHHFIYVKVLVVRTLQWVGVAQYVLLLREGVVRWARCTAQVRSGALAVAATVLQSGNGEQQPAAATAVLRDQKHAALVGHAISVFLEVSIDWSSLQFRQSPRRDLHTIWSTMQSVRLGLKHPTDAHNQSNCESLSTYRLDQ